MADNMTEITSITPNDDLELFKDYLTYRDVKQQLKKSTKNLIGRHIGVLIKKYYPK